MQLANGTKSVIDFIMEDNPDLSKEDAIERYNEIQKEKSAYAIGGTEMSEAMGVESATATEE